MSSPDFACHLASYQDMVEELSILSLNFQKDNLPACAVMHLMMDTKDALKAMEQHPGPNLKALMNFIDAAAESGTEDAILYHGVHFDISPAHVQRFRRKREMILRKISSTLDERLDSCIENPIVQASEILDPSHNPHNLRLPNFGIFTY